MKYGFWVVGGLMVAYSLAAMTMTKVTRLDEVDLAIILETSYATQLQLWLMGGVVMIGQGFVVASRGEDTRRSHVPAGMADRQAVDNGS